MSQVLSQQDGYWSNQTIYCFSLIVTSNDVNCFQRVAPPDVIPIDVPLLLLYPKGRQDCRQPPPCAIEPGSVFDLLNFAIIPHMISGSCPRPNNGQISRTIFVGSSTSGSSACRGATRSRRWCAASPGCRFMSTRATPPCPPLWFRSRDGTGRPDSRRQARSAGCWGGTGRLRSCAAACERPSADSARLAHDRGPRFH